MNILSDLQNDQLFSQDVTISAGVTKVYDASSTLKYTNYSVVHTPFYLWLIFWLVSIFVIGRLFLEFIIYMRRK